MLNLLKNLGTSWEQSRDGLYHDLEHIETVINRRWGATFGDTNILGPTIGGTGLTHYVLGDTLFASATDVLSRLAGNTSTTREFLRQVGTGVVSAAPAWDTIQNADISGAAFTKTDDTNVTATLTGTPTTAVLRTMNLALGWTGTLTVSRGGTGLGSLLQGDLLYGSAANTLSALAKNTTATRYLSNTGSSNNPAWAQVDLSNGVTGLLPIANGGTGSSSSGDITKSDDTNVTLTLGGTPTGAVLKSTSFTLGWTGTLGVARGGTNANLSATGGTNQVLKQSSSGAAITVGTLASTNLSDSSNIPLLNANNHFTGTGTTQFDGNEKFATTQNFSWNTKSQDTVYQAASDGFIVGAGQFITAGSSVQILTDSSNPPTTERQLYSNGTADSSSMGWCCPVIKGDFYKVVVSGPTILELFWVPLGTAG